MSEEIKQPENQVESAPTDKGDVKQTEEIPGTEVNPEGPPDGIEVSDVDWNAPDPDEQPEPTLPEQSKPEAEESKEAKTPAEEDKKPDEESMASVRKKIVKGMEEKSEQEKAEIAAKYDSKIEALTNELRQFQSIQQPQLTGKEDQRIKALQEEFGSLDQKMEDEKDVLTAVDALQLSRRQDEIKREIEFINHTKVNAERSQNDAVSLRNKADAILHERYPFMSKPDSAEYKMAINEVYPMLKAINPNFSNLPQDLIIAAEFTEFYRDALAYRELMGKQPKPASTIPKAFSTEPITPAKTKPPSKNLNTLLEKAEKGELGDHGFGTVVELMMEEKGG